jgi:hypothetical protein
MLDFSLYLSPAAHREPRDTRQRQSSPQPGGEVWSRRACGTAEAHLSRKMRSGAVGHVDARPYYLS